MHMKEAPVVAEFVSSMTERPILWKYTITKTVTAMCTVMVVLINASDNIPRTE